MLMDGLFQKIIYVFSEKKAKSVIFYYLFLSLYLKLCLTLDNLYIMS